MERTGTRASRRAASEKETPPPFVHFGFYRLDPAYRKLLPNEKVVAKQEFLAAVDRLQSSVLVLPYSCVGLRADCDLMLWRIGSKLGELQESAARLLAAGTGRYLTPTRSFLGLAYGPYPTSAPEGSEPPPPDFPGRLPYLFVEPVIRTAEWHRLSEAAREEQDREVAAVFGKFQGVRGHHFASLGLDDQDSILAAEAEEPRTWSRLSQALRGTQVYATREAGAPTYTCLRQDLRDALEHLG